MFDHMSLVQLISQEQKNTFRKVEFNPRQTKNKTCQACQVIKQFDNIVVGYRFQYRQKKLFRANRYRFWYRKRTWFGEKKYHFGIKEKFGYVGFGHFFGIDVSFCFFFTY